MMIKLEIGKKYIARNGEKVEITSDYPRPYSYINGKTYYWNGSFMGNEKEHPYDLVALADEEIKGVHKCEFTRTNGYYNRRCITCGRFEEEKPARYMVMASSGSLPTKIHNTLEEAETEAKRLAALETHKQFSVIQILKTYKAKIEVEEV